MKIIRGNEGETREKRGKKRKKEGKKGKKAKNEAILRSFENNIFNEIIRNTYLQNDKLENMKGMENLELRTYNKDFFYHKDTKTKRWTAGVPSSLRYAGPVCAKASPGRQAPSAKGCKEILISKS